MVGSLTPARRAPLECLQERDGASPGSEDGNLVARYTCAPGYIDDMAGQERDLNSDGDFGDTNEVVYYHSNTLYSIYALTDGSENVVERCRSAKPSSGSFA
ncbi:MAG: hypothetical protein ACOC7S_02900 [Planctomycetota bacterium]